MMAGVRSGRLGEVLGEFSEYSSVGIELRRRLWLNLAYPILTLAITLASLRVREHRRGAAIPRRSSWTSACRCRG